MAMHQYTDGVRSTWAMTSPDPALDLSDQRRSSLKAVPLTARRAAVHRIVTIAGKKNLCMGSLIDLLSPTIIPEMPAQHGDLI